jgi:hypothetical protein
MEGMAIETDNGGDALRYRALRYRALRYRTVRYRVLR